MANTCEGVKYTCGDTIETKTGEYSSLALVHSVSTALNFNIGIAELPLFSKIRDFSLNVSDNNNFNPSFAMSNGEGGYFTCGGTPSSSVTGNVAESYQYVITELCFLDLRYDNAAGITTTEILTFDNTSNVKAGFQCTWGLVYFHKFHITNAVVARTKEYFVIINGVKSILKTVVTTEKIFYPGNPLILVYPNPPSLAIPQVNCEDIKVYGFYDYYAVGEGEGQEKIRRDGGDDFYYTDWMRLIGIPNQAFDQAQAEKRYYADYLGGGGPETESVTASALFVDSTPRGSIATDKNGNSIYSFKFDGSWYNGISKGNIISILESPKLQGGTDISLYPLGVV